MFLMGEALTGEVVLFVCLYVHIQCRSGCGKGAEPLNVTIQGFAQYFPQVVVQLIICNIQF